MATKKKQKRHRGCENGGGLGILPCQEPSPVIVQVWCDPSFLCRDTGRLYLCLDCAEALKEHAAHFDYDVIIEDE